jgi:hypothetical protein
MEIDRRNGEVWRARFKPSRVLECHLLGAPLVPFREGRGPCHWGDLQSPGRLLNHAAVGMWAVSDGTGIFLSAVGFLRPCLSACPWQGPGGGLLVARQDMLRTDVVVHNPWNVGCVDLWVPSNPEGLHILAHLLRRSCLELCVMAMMMMMMYVMCSYNRNIGHYVRT